MRLIDADGYEQTIGSMIKPYGDGTFPSDEAKMIAAETIVGCIELLRKAPTVEAAPEVHGRWVEIQTEPERLCKCSECGYPGRSFWDKTKYCHSCGAKMGKED